MHPRNESSLETYKIQIHFGPHQASQYVMGLAGRLAAVEGVAFLKHKKQASRHFFSFAKFCSGSFLKPRFVKALQVVPKKNQVDAVRSSQESGRSVLAFAALAVLCVLPLFAILWVGVLKQKGTSIERGLSQQGQAASQDLLSAFTAAGSLDLFEARKEFQEAADDFRQTGQALSRELGPFEKIIGFVPRYGVKVRAARALVDAGEAMALAGQEIMASLAQLINKASLLTLTERLSGMEEHLSFVMPLWERVLRDLEQIRPEVLPSQYSEAFSRAQTLFPVLASAARNAAQWVAFLQKVLGDKEQKRYVLIFQNNAEIRPTGGFMGSLALVDVYQGNIRRLEVPQGGIYDIAGQSRARVRSPEPLWVVNPRWNIQDANWFPDFPASAKKILWFWSQSDMPTVDGIITLTPNVVEDFLAILGPVDMEEKYQTVITQENFIDFTQETTSKQPQETVKPKEFLADFMPILLQKVLTSSASDMPAFLALLTKAVNAKDILLYMRDQSLQEFVESQNLAGSLQKEPGDYLGIFRTNIRGNKTDRVIAEEMSYNIEVREDASALVSIILTRHHQGHKGEKFYGLRNFTYLRFYAPKGSKLVSAEGFSPEPRSLFEIPDESDTLDMDLAGVERQTSFDPATGARQSLEFGKQVFGFWTIMEPGETTTLRLTYQTPSQLFFNESGVGFYRVYFQKQPGVKPIPLEASIQFSKNFEISKIAPFGAAQEENSLRFKGEWDQDMIMGAALKKKNFLPQ